MYRTMMTLLVSLLLLLMVGSAYAADVTLAWDPNDPTPDGYRIFVREGNNTYDYNAPAWEGQATSGTIKNLTLGSTYYFVVRAFQGVLESADSNEVTYVVPTVGLSIVINPRVTKTVIPVPLE